MIRDAATLHMAGFDAMAFVRADPVERKVMMEIYKTVCRRVDPGPAEG